MFRSAVVSWSHEETRDDSKCAHSKVEIIMKSHKKIKRKHRAVSLETSIHSIGQFLPAPG